ncbi:HD domain-containing protein [Anoxynatronum sibiricum]|uniref:HD domain-containing protein n=1 Tax=Anoxynatronum sibiricum TaxID=210623 RepID=A0ABU9VSQ7_9CLOT
MPETRKKAVMSAIDIGSYSLKMKIVEVDEDGQVHTIEKLSKPASLGRDTFSMGKVSYETVEEACDIVTGFQRLMQEYQSKHYRAVATSAIREAQNRDYLVDQIKLKTGLKVEVLTNAQERFLTYKAIRENLPDHQTIRKDGVMVVEIGSGSIEMSLYHQGALQRTHNLKLGHLRLREVLSTLEQRTQDFPNLLEEYVESHLDILRFIRERYQLNHFIALGSEMRTISKLCNQTDQADRLRTISMEAFTRFYREMVKKPTPLLARDYGLPSDMAATLLPSMMVLKKCVEMTNARCLYTPLVSLADGIVADFIDQRFKTHRQQEFLEDVQELALGMARKYHADMNHAADVETKSIAIFDALKKTHGMKEREKYLLRLAAKLHDIGKFVNLNKHYIHSYNLIKASEMLGVTEEEQDIVANVARYHSSQIPQQSHENYWHMRPRNRVVTAKLVAIIRMADALDRSHRQKISGLSIAMKGDTMMIKGESVEEALLEEWTFEVKSEFFQEVFGIRPQLKVKRKMAHAENA